MMNRHINFLFLVICYCNANLSEKFQICSRSDPKINECLKSAIQNALVALKNGFPDINIPPLEPIKISNWTVKALPPLNFDQKYTNIELQNHLAYEIKEASSIIGDKQFSLTFKASNPEIRFVADYDYQNAILGGVDMSSKGKSYCNGFNFTITADFTGEIRRNGNEEYIFITDVILSSVNVDSAEFGYESEDVEMGKTLTKYFLDNWERVVTKEKNKYAAIYAHGYKNEANAVFARIPYNVLFPK